MRFAARHEFHGSVWRSVAGLAAVWFFTAICGCTSSRPRSELAYFPAPPSSPHFVHLKSFNRLADLVPSRSTFVDIMRGQSASPFVDTPAGIAYHDGHLYVCDVTLRTVHDWNLNSGEANRLSIAGSKPLKTPTAVAVDWKGRIYVADAGRGEVETFNADGHSGAALKPPGSEAFRPVALAIHGDEIFVADSAGAQVFVFAAGDGHVVRTIGGASENSTQHFLPMGVAVSDDGTTFITDMMGGRVLVFTGDGKFLRAFGERGDRYGDMAEPRQIAAASDSVLFIADPEFAHVHIFNEKGDFLMLLGAPNGKLGATPLPVGVAIAQSLPEPITRLVPADFDAKYFLFVSNSIGDRRISLYAVGGPR